MAITQLNILDAIAEGERLRDAGIQLAVAHADEVVPNWSDRAYGLLKEFLSDHQGEFMAETFRSFCAMVDFPMPENSRAFGGVIRKAAFDGLIRKVGHGQVSNVKAHRCFASVWIKNIL